MRSVLGKALLLALLVVTATAQQSINEDTELIATVIRAEMKANNLTKRDYLCLSIAQDEAANQMLSRLNADGLTLHKPKHCMFRGYQIHISPVESSQTEVRARTTDFRYKDTDLAVILRDGRYKLEKAENGKWSVSEYVPVATPTGR